MSKAKTASGAQIKTALAAALLPIALALTLAVSCASAPRYPVYPPPITRTLPVDFQVAFTITRGVITDDPRVDVQTLDTAGRIIGEEKTRGIIFWQEKTILDFFLQPVEPAQTKVTLFLRAEQYEWGGLFRAAGWYPSSDVDAILGEDVLGLIQQRAQQAASNQITPAPNAMP